MQVDRSYSQAEHLLHMFLAVEGSLVSMVSRQTAGVSLSQTEVINYPREKKKTSALSVWAQHSVWVNILTELHTYLKKKTQTLQLYLSLRNMQSNLCLSG